MRTVPPDTAPAPPSARDGGLRPAAAVFTGAVLLHNLDHLRRGAESVRLDVFALGTLAVAVEIAIVALIVLRHPLAPAAAATVGSSLAAGYLLVHFTPGRQLASDSLLRGASPVSILAAAVEVASAVTLAAAGLLALHRSRLPVRAGEVRAVRPARRATRDPILVAMAGGNALILAASVVSRWW